MTAREWYQRISRYRQSKAIGPFKTTSVPNASAQQVVQRFFENRNRPEDLGRFNDDV